MEEALTVDEIGTDGQREAKLARLRSENLTSKVDPYILSTDFNTFKSISSLRNSLFCRANASAPRHATPRTALLAVIMDVVRGRYRIASAKKYGDDYRTVIM